MSLELGRQTGVGVFSRGRPLDLLPRRLGGRRCVGVRVVVVVVGGAIGRGSLLSLAALVLLRVLGQPRFETCLDQVLNGILPFDG